MNVRTGLSPIHVTIATLFLLYSVFRCLLMRGQIVEMTMNSSMCRIAIMLLLVIGSVSARAGFGADMPWRTYEAEDMKTTGEISGPGYGPNMVEAESSGQECVMLDAREYVEFKVQDAANAIVVRYSLPDSNNGGGLNSSLSLYQNGRFVRKIPVTSRYSRLYGQYPFSNDPSAGAPRNFYDEARLKEIAVKPGDILRLEKDADGVRYCVIDLVDLENIAPPLAAPGDSISVTEFGAVGDGESDATAALRSCIAAARQRNKTIWVPRGTFKITGDIDLPSDVTIRGAGMWHTTFVGDDAQYANPGKRVRFNGRGGHIHLSDFAIIGKLTYRNDSEPNDGLGESFGENSTISRIWIEHTKTGMWINNSSNLVVEDCRLRDTIADGINFCVGMRNSIIQNCAARGTGDDCFAIWPATHTRQIYTPGHNVIRHCTGQLPFLANGAAIYGGESNCIEDSLFMDVLSGCGILLSTTFPTSNDRFDNNFSGTTVVRDCDLLRCGGFDPWRAWRAAFQLCVDRRNISGVNITNANIRDSISDGFSVVASAGEHGHGTLTNAVLDNVNIPNCGIAVSDRHGLWICRDAYGSLMICNSRIVEEKNSSDHFTLSRNTPVAAGRTAQPPLTLSASP
jgi:hypothetical protein